MPQELQEWRGRDEILSYEEIARVLRVAVGLGVRKVRVTGGEPLTRRGILELFEMIDSLPAVDDVGVSTNGTLLAREVEPGVTMAAGLRARGVRTVNVSLDTLDRADYAAATGRDFLPNVLAGIEAASDAGFGAIKLNAVLMRGRSEAALGELVRFAGERGLLLRLIELMPVTTGDVLNEKRFFPVREAKRRIGKEFGELIPEPGFRTNGPAVYYQIPGTGQRIGFIGAMTDLHFCESCNKMRLTCEGKLRPCLGSHLEFDLREALRGGASDADLQQIFLDVVARKPREHDFRNAYVPGRGMVAIGG